MLLDPCAGSGTIPLEAAQVFPTAKTHGADKSAAVVHGAQANASAADLTGRCTFIQGNCREVHKKYAPATFDCIVSNLPWGVQTAKGGGGDLLERIYRGLLASSWHVTKPGARAALLVLKWPLLLDLARRSGLWAVEALVPVRTSALSPVAMVLVRRDADEEKRGVLEKLHALSTFFYEERPQHGRHETGGEEASEEASRGEGAVALAADDEEEHEKAENKASSGQGEEERAKGKGTSSARTSRNPSGSLPAMAGAAAADGSIVPFIKSKFTTRVAYESWAQQQRQLQHQKGKDRRNGGDGRRPPAGQQG